MPDDRVAKNFSTTVLTQPNVALGLGWAQITLRNCGKNQRPVPPATFTYYDVVWRTRMRRTRPTSFAFPGFLFNAPPCILLCNPTDQGFKHTKPPELGPENETEKKPTANKKTNRLNFNRVELQCDHFLRTSYNKRRWTKDFLKEIRNLIVVNHLIIFILNFWCDFTCDIFF